jgi:hypothetical protein
VKIGLDFDNTIVCYDGVFHCIGLEQGLIPPDVPTDKEAVRDYLRAQGLEATWTALQGEVYGSHILSCPPFPGLLDFLRDARAARHQVFIVSHKTLRPFAGAPFDLHAAAREWLKVAGVASLVDPDDVYFELTKEQKIARLSRLGCDVFVDDLPEFLCEPGFPPHVRRILFDPVGRARANPAFTTIGSWRELGALLLGVSA